MESRLAGIPLSSTFFVKICQVIKKKGPDIEVQTYGGIQWVESTIWRAIIRIKTLGEMETSLKMNTKLAQEVYQEFKRNGARR
jgi:hypothetical protein